MNQGPITIIKMKTASETGRRIALDYLEQHKDQTIQSLLDELIRLTELATHSKSIVLSPIRPMQTSTSNQIKYNFSVA